MALTAAQRERHRTRLLELRDEIVRAGDIDIDPARADPTDIKADEDAQALNEMNQVIASKRNRARSGDLERVLAALRRLDEAPDSFGLCAECEEPIGRRLEVMPYVELCVECQQERDAPRAGPRRHLLDFK